MPLTFRRRLKSFNTRAGRTVYTVGQINVYPIPMYVVQMLTSKLPCPRSPLVDISDFCCLCTAYAWAWWSDAIGLRWPPIVFAGVGLFRVLPSACYLLASVRRQVWGIIVTSVLAATPVYTHIARYVNSRLSIMSGKLNGANL